MCPEHRNIESHQLIFKHFFTKCWWHLMNILRLTRVTERCRTSRKSISVDVMNRYYSSIRQLSASMSKQSSTRTSSSRFGISAARQAFGHTGGATTQTLTQLSTSLTAWTAIALASPNRNLFPCLRSAEFCLLVVSSWWHLGTK